MVISAALPGSGVHAWPMGPGRPARPAATSSRSGSIDSNLTHLRLARPRSGRGGRLGDCRFDSTLLDLLAGVTSRSPGAGFQRSRRHSNGRIDHCSITGTTFSRCSFEEKSAHSSTISVTAFEHVRMKRSGFDRFDFADVTISGTLESVVLKSVRAQAPRSSSGKTDSTRTLSTRSAMRSGSAPSGYLCRAAWGGAPPARP